MPIILVLSARIGCGVPWVILIVLVSDSSNAMLLLGGWVLQAQNRIEAKTATVNCLIFECQSQYWLQSNILHGVYVSGNQRFNIL